MTAALATHLIYVTVAVGLTTWLARMLYAHGDVFLADVFEGRTEIATALNRLLVVGFQMLNLGWALIIVRGDTTVTNAAEAANALVDNLGILLVTLGLIHFVNMLVFWRIRARRELRNNPPVRPTAMVPPPPMPVG